MNKIIEVQEILFNEMKRLNNDKLSDLSNNKEAKNEYERATAIYNMSTGFIKALNTNISIMQIAKRENTKYEQLMNKLGL